MVFWYWALVKTSLKKENFSDVLGRGRQWCIFKFRWRKKFQLGSIMLIKCHKQTKIASKWTSYLLLSLFPIDQKQQLMTLEPEKAGAPVWINIKCREPVTALGWGSKAFLPPASSPVQLSVRFMTAPAAGHLPETHNCFINECWSCSQAQPGSAEGPELRNETKS